MHPSNIFIPLLPPLLLGLAAAQAPAATLVATQSPTVTEVTSLQTVAGSVVGVPVVFTQTFAATALGSWPLGTAVRKGTVGLGDISGSVGGVKTA